LTSQSKFITTIQTWGPEFIIMISRNIAPPAQASRRRTRAIPMNPGWHHQRSALTEFLAVSQFEIRRIDKPSREAFGSCMLSGKQEEPMSKASGLVVETPTQKLPFKAVISEDGKTVEEQYFASREEAEVYIVNTLKGFDDLPSEEEDLK
jgi:hypothetical protein